MNPSRLRLIWLVSLVCLLPLRAAQPDLRELLRDALYTEEVTRDPDKAAQQYEELVARHDAQKTFAASALFRLAEVRRKQDRKDEAIQLYQRLIAEFPNAETETKLARENLAALGGGMAFIPNEAADEEGLEIRRLEGLRKNSPDLVNLDELENAVKRGRIRVVTWLIQVGKVDLAGSGILSIAAYAGHVRMIEILMDLAGDSLHDQMPEAMVEAINNGFLEVVRTLLKRGGDPDAVIHEAHIWFDPHLSEVKLNGGRPLILALASGDPKIAELLLDHKADVRRPEGRNGVTPLFAAAGNPKAARFIERLLDMGADANADVRFGVDVRSKTKECVISPLQYAVMMGAMECAETLIKRGADLNCPDFFRLIDSRILREKDANLVRFLIGAGVSPDLPVSDGRTVLAWAVKWDNTDLIKFLLSKGANPNLPAPSHRENDKNPNLVQDVALQGRAEILKLLLDAGGDPKVAPYGEWLLRCVAGSGSADDEEILACIKLLVEKGLVPENDWRKEGFRGAEPKTLAYLKGRFSDAVDKKESNPSN